MAKIPLRIYLKNIENLIERGNLEQAIVHAKNILQTYPKHTDTYRLLGKAYLESQRYSEASDILQRILSVFPDDFISHIGMSIIREDELNLDAAIWHMERAYEVQPFNPAVQDELRRLYGRRDGAEPPRIRLTRGALVRMYARGGLYQQAIAEIHAALAEEPQRIDLQVLLARMFYLNGQRLEATEVCSAIINKLPYCYEANSILAEILPGTTRAADAAIFVKRIHSLDPYMAYLSSSAPTADKVPDQAVTVEELVLSDGSIIETKAPEWTLTAGVEWEETPGEELPGWLNTLAVQTPTPTSESQITSPGEFEVKDQPIESEDDLLPEWMRSAGWSQTDHPETETPPVLDETEAEALPGEVPTWLQDIAPTTETTSEEEQERVEWLESILPGEDQETTKANLDLAGELVDTPDESISVGLSAPDWLADLEAESLMPRDEVQPDASQQNNETPWIASFTQASEQMAGDGVINQEQPTIPDWLTALGDEKGGSEVPSDVPEWLQGLENEGQTKPFEETSLTSEIANSMGVMENLVEEVDLNQVGDGNDQPDQVEAGVPWFETLPEGEKSEETLVSQSEQTTEKTFDWSPLDTEIIESAVPAQQTEPDEGTDQEPEEWLNKLQVEGESESISSPKWEIEQSEQEIPTTPPDLIEQPEAKVVEIPDEFAQATSEISTGTNQPDLSDMDAAMAWLESLAARQGADEETLTIPPDLRTDTPPAWISTDQPLETDGTENLDFPQGELIEEEPVAAVEVTEQIESEIPGDLPGIIGDEPITPVLGEKMESVGEMTIGVPDAEVSKPTPDLSDMDAAMAWLESLAANQGADEATLITPPEQRTATPPDWISESLADQETSPVDEMNIPPVVEEPLSEIDFEAEVPTSTSADTQEATVAVESENIDMDNAFAWLESLAARQGAEEETLITRPEDRIEEVPEWIERAAEQVLAEEPVGVDQTSEWIQEFEETEPTVEPEDTRVVHEEQNGTDWLTGETNLTEPVLSAESKDESLDDWLKGLESKDEILESPGLVPVQQEETVIGWESIEAPGSINQISDSTSAIEINSLAEAQSALMRGNLEVGLAYYNKNIHEGLNLDDIIHDLRDALYRYPVDIEIWQTLGDAYARNNQLQDALDAYTKAEELLR